MFDTITICRSESDELAVRVSLTGTNNVSSRSRDTVVELIPFSPAHSCPWVLSRIPICFMALPETHLSYEARKPNSALPYYAPESLRSVCRLCQRLLFGFSSGTTQLLHIR